MRPILSILAWLCARFSRPGIQRAGAAVGFLIGSVFRFRRGEVEAVLRRCFPEKSAADVRAVARGMYRHLGILLIEFLSLPYLDKAALGQDVVGDGLEKVIEMLGQQHGLIVLTAHLGNFEWMAMAGAARGAPLTVLTKAFKPEGLNDWWVETRARAGIRLLPVHRSYRQCRKVLAANGVLGFMLDQNRPVWQGIFVDFFGRPACTSPGLAMLSARTGAPVLPVFIVREPDGRHRITAGEPLPPPAPDRESVRRATQTYTAIIEAAVRRHPEQWIWLHRRWRTQPSASPDTAAALGNREFPGGPDRLQF